MIQKINFEILWWIITAVIAVLILLPIYLNLGESYPFYLDNIILIIISITWMRYIFFLKYHWITVSNYVKSFFMIFSIPVFFFIMGAFYDFNSFYDDGLFDAILSVLPYKSQANMLLYIRTEMIFFLAFAFICNFMLPFRMIMSIWRKINKGTE
ncbi:hypothetical protein N9L92_03570 [Saprospiraceae bacterium]|nr:hypothetical protein [Saprospiraceae bacterium]